MDHACLFYQEALPNPILDHLPILLLVGELSSGPRSFRFEPMWLDIPGLRIKLWWEDMEVEGLRLRLRILH